MSRAWILSVVLCACLWPAAAQALENDQGGFATSMWVATAIVVVISWTLSRVQPWAGFVVYPYVLFVAYQLTMQLTGQVPHLPFDHEAAANYYSQAVGSTALQLLVPIVGYVQGRKAQ